MRLFFHSTWGSLDCSNIQGVAALCTHHWCTNSDHFLIKWLLTVPVHPCSLFHRCLGHPYNSPRDKARPREPSIGRRSLLLARKSPPQRCCPGGSRWCCLSGLSRWRRCQRNPLRRWLRCFLGIIFDYQITKDQKSTKKTTRAKNSQKELKKRENNMWTALNASWSLTLSSKCICCDFRGKGGVFEFLLRSSHLGPHKFFVSSWGQAQPCWGQPGRPLCSQKFRLSSHIFGTASTLSRTAWLTSLSSLILLVLIKSAGPHKFCWSS